MPPLFQAAVSPCCNRPVAGECQIVPAIPPPLSRRFSVVYISVLFSLPSQVIKEPALVMLPSQVIKEPALVTITSHKRTSFGNACTCIPSQGIR